MKILMIAILISLCSNLAWAQKINNQEDIEKLSLKSKFDLQIIIAKRYANVNLVCLQDATLDGLRLVGSAVTETLPFAGFLLSLIDRIDEEEFDGDMLYRQKSLIREQIGYYKDPMANRLMGNNLGGFFSALGGYFLTPLLDIVDYINSGDDSWYYVNTFTDEFMTAVYARTLVKAEDLVEDSDACLEAQEKYYNSIAALAIKTAETDNTAKHIVADLEQSKFSSNTQSTSNVSTTQALRD